MTTTHDLDELNEIDVPQLCENQGDGLPRIWWKYGNAQAKIAGHFYARAADWDGDLPAPWAACELYEGEAGWKAETVKVLLITKRSQPYTKVKQGTKVYRQYVDWPQRGTPWPQGMQIHTEYVTFVEGMLGPVVFSFHGATGTAMEAKAGIVPTADKALAQEASKLYKKKIGLSAFWLPIGPELNVKGQPHFVLLPEGSKINSPALRLPADKEGKALLTALYAGKDAIAEVALVRGEYAEWCKEQRTNDAAPAPTPAASGVNAPQAYDPDEVM